MGWEQRPARPPEERAATGPRRAWLRPTQGTWGALARVALVVALALGLWFQGLNGAAQGADQAAPAIAPVAQHGTLAIAGAGGATLYATPGGEPVTTLPAGTVLTAVGRTGDGLWVVVTRSDGTTGWAEVDQVVMFGLETLPVMIDGGMPANGNGSAPAPTAGEAQAPLQLPTPTATSPATPTPTPSPTPSPTPTPPPTPTPTPSPTASPAPARPQPAGGQGTLVAVVRGGGTELYERPNGDVLQVLSTGTALTAWGRSEDGQWLVVTTSSGAAGWVEVNKVVIFNVDTLAVVDAGAGGPGTQPAAAANGEAVPAEQPVGADPLVPPAENPQPASAVPTGDGIVATVSITDSRLNIRSGPGTEYAVIGKALPGESYVATGRNSSATWVEISAPDLENGSGWVSAEFVTLNRPILGLPVSTRAGRRAPAVQAGTSNPAQPTGLAGNLVFQSVNGGMIYVYELGTGRVRDLTGGYDPAVSSDGRTVAFTRIGGEHGLYLIDIDGQNERRIYSGSESLRAPTWSPDGSLIAFVRVAGSYSCRDVGFGLCLPNNPFLGGFPLDQRAEWGLSRVDRDGQQFLDLPALTSVQAPDWGDDGVVYQTVSGIEITSDRPDATTRAVVKADYFQDPSLQPNGDRVVFQSREGSHWEIFSVNLDGSGLVALTRPQTTLVDQLPSNVAPAWSPDGRQIVFLSNRDAKGEAAEWRLWVMDADGSNQRPLPVSVPIDYSYTNEQVVSWGVPS